jgi:hypothetical protein
MLRWPGLARGALPCDFTHPCPLVWCFLQQLDAAAVRRHFPALRVIANVGAGVDHIDVGQCEALGIRVGNTPGVTAAATADVAMGLLLSTARNLVVGDKLARSPGFTKIDPYWCAGVCRHWVWAGGAAGAWACLCLCWASAQCPPPQAVAFACTGRWCPCVSGSERRCMAPPWASLAWVPLASRCVGSLS